MSSGRLRYVRYRIIPNSDNIPLKGKISVDPLTDCVVSLSDEISDRLLIDRSMGQPLTITNEEEAITK